MSEQADDATTTYELTVEDAVRFAVAAIQRGGRADGRALLQRVLDVDPDNVNAIHFMAVAAFQDEEIETSKALFARAIELGPHQPDIWSNYGNLCAELEDEDGAIDAYRKALALAPDAYHITGNLVSVLRVTRRYDEAVKLVEEALAREPDSSILLNNASNVFSDLGEWQRASLYLARLMDLQKPTRNILEARAELYMRAGEIEKAIAAYKDLLATVPDDPQVLHQLSALSGENVPARASDGYIKQLFDGFSQSFDAQLKRLDYRAPFFVADALAKAKGEQRGTLDILDAGCGTGLCGPLIKGYARHLTGIDLSEGMLVRARRRNVYDALEQTELTQYMLEHVGAFDAITCADTFCYFGDLFAVCAAARGALRDGSVFLFTVEENLQDGQPHRIQPHGRYCHSEDHVRAACKAAGFSDVAVERGVLRSETGKPVEGLIVTARY